MTSDSKAMIGIRLKTPKNQVNETSFCIRFPSILEKFHHRGFLLGNLGIFSRISSNSSLIGIAISYIAETENNTAYYICYT